MLELEGRVGFAQSRGTQNSKGHIRERVSQVQPFGDHLHHFCTTCTIIYLIFIFKAAFTFYT